MDLETARLVLQRFFEDLLGLAIAPISEVDLGLGQGVDFFGDLGLGCAGPRRGRDQRRGVAARRSECSYVRSFFFCPEAIRRCALAAADDPIAYQSQYQGQNSTTCDQISRLSEQIVQQAGWRWRWRHAPRARLGFGLRLR